MAVDFGKPATSDNYSSQFTQNIQANIVGLAQLLDSSLVSITGSITTGTKRYNAASTALEEWNGSAWVVKTLQGIRFSSGNLAVGVAPIASFPLTIHTGANRNIAVFDQSSMATIGAATDAGAAASMRVAASTLIFSGDGGTEHVRLSTTGNLGIGGVSAGERLSVFGTARVAGGTGTVASLTLTGGSSNFQFNHTSGSGVAQIANSGGALAFASGGVSTQMLLDSGRLYIGATAAGVRLLNINATNPAMTLKSTVASGGAIVLLLRQQRHGHDRLVELRARQQPARLWYERRNPSLIVGNRSPDPSG